MTVEEDLRTRTYYTPREVQAHNSPHDDCWVSFLGLVYDMTPLLRENPGELAQPIADVAGTDISHWFDPKTSDVKRHMNVNTGLEEYYIPMGRFLQIPPSDPTDDFQTDFELPWWMDHKRGEASQYWVGMLSAKTRPIRIVNMLTKDEHTLEVCSEDTLAQIEEKYLKYNMHAASYTWKRIPDGGAADMQLLDMAKNLEGNGVRDESGEYEDLGMDEDYYTPSLHLYFKDDLTVA
eukprot:CAMPEP_0180133432 /NCGR_PEP_ID=MMETSP0986-20121125/9541_1 /TAXON_ID=697907 /ORGANISM="non described non described, Strain CCMP2293" /LENGTH=234 /DNA_ID=CAMNT_0022073557 /DNA_START=128 /DNA_END=832 /DNA_ORIENTATION=+